MFNNSQTNSREPQTSYLFAVIGLVWLAVFLIALTGYPNLMDNERRVGAYVLDAVQNGHWLAQRDSTGEIAAKPPLLMWIAALATLPFGRISRFAIYLPSALATLGVAWGVLAVGRMRWGWLAGFCGALAYMLSPLADNQVVTARYDGLFAFPVFLAAIAAFNAWISGRGWTLFWLAATVATMVKGPLGIFLGASGLLAAFWEKRSGEPVRIRGSHLFGIIIFLAITGGWFALAYAQMGQPFIDKLIGRELVGHVLKDGDHTPGGGFYEPTLNSITHFLPWSIFTALGLWRVWKKPSPDKEARCFERFLFCWFFLGLLVFSIAAHQRGRLIFPLMPAAALLAGRELARLLSMARRKMLLKLAVVATTLTLVVFATYHHWLVGRSRHVKETVGIKEMASSVRQLVGEQFPLTHLGSPFAIQFYLNTMRPWVEPEQAAELLRGDAAAFVVVRNVSDLTDALGTDSPALHELLRWPAKGDPFLRVVSNRPRLEWSERMATIIGPVLLRTEGLKLQSATENEFIFLSETNSTNSVTLSNLSARPQKIRVQIQGAGKKAVQTQILLPGEVWKCKAS